MTNYAVAEFKHLYIPFDYSFAPTKEYIPCSPFTDLQICTLSVENALRSNSCTAKMAHDLASLLKQQAPFERPEIIEDAECLLDDIRERIPELFE